MFILLIFVIVTTDQGIAANSSHSSMSTIFASTLAPPEVYGEFACKQKPQSRLCASNSQQSF